MIRVTLFSAADMADLMAQAPDHAWPVDLQAQTIAMAARGRAFTLRTDGGRLLALVGLLEVHAHSATAWTVMAPGCWGHMGAITRIISDYLDRQSYRRIDMLVRADFAAGHRWARRLGFHREAVLRAWAQDGGDMVMHARIREWIYG